MQIEEKVLLEDIAYNFIFGGDDFIFEGRSFDVTGKHTKCNKFIKLFNYVNYQWYMITGEDYDSIGILFIGNYSENSPKPSLITKLLNEFLPYAVNLGKLEKDYKIFGQRQGIENTTSPGDSFFEKIKEWPHFDAEKKPIICQFGCNG